MSSQKSIKSYFKATPPKRPALTSANDSSPSKRAKCSTDAAAAGDEKQDKSPQPAAADDEMDAVIRKQARVTPALSDNIGHSWFRALRDEFSKKYFVSLSAFLDQERRSATVFPPVSSVYTWTRHCAIEDVKVVILGQDPYHGPNQAHGLAFSVCRKVDQPPSLRNIFKVRIRFILFSYALFSDRFSQELQSDVKGFSPPSHGDLTGWAEQGVLLLNTVLTVRAHNANSHATRGWEHLTDAVIKWLDRNADHLVFLLWGRPAEVTKCAVLSAPLVRAPFLPLFPNDDHILTPHSSSHPLRLLQKKSDLIDHKKHLILKSVHPSPLSASRGFFGCKHFSKANEFLQANGKEPIDWKRLD